jgi:hypothetical protein
VRFANEPKVQYPFPSLRCAELSTLSLFQLLNSSIVPAST